MGSPGSTWFCRVLLGSGSAGFCRVPVLQGSGSTGFGFGGGLQGSGSAGFGFYWVRVRRGSAGFGFLGFRWVRVLRRSAGGTRAVLPTVGGSSIPTHSRLGRLRGTTTAE